MYHWYLIHFNTWVTLVILSISLNEKILLISYHPKQYFSKTIVSIDIYINFAAKSAMVHTKESKFSRLHPNMITSVWMYIQRCNFAKYQCRNNRICCSVLRRNWNCRKLFSHFQICNERGWVFAMDQYIYTTLAK